MRTFFKIIALPVFLSIIFFFWAWVTSPDGNITINIEEFKTGFKNTLPIYKFEPAPHTLMSSLGVLTGILTAAIILLTHVFGFLTIFMFITGQFDNTKSPNSAAPSKEIVNFIHNFGATSSCGEVRRLINDDLITIIINGKAFSVKNHDH